MSVVYKSITYDLGLFDISQIGSVILASDKDSGVSIEFSFDGGSTFSAYDINTKYVVNQSSTKVVAKIIFDDSSNGIYLIPVSGNYQMLSIGTPIIFESESSGVKYRTAIGPNGMYKIDLPPDVYTVKYMTSPKTEVVLQTMFNPSVATSGYESLAKESMVEMFVRHVDWVDVSIFDVFTDKSKMVGNVELDFDGNLIDTSTNKVCRWWALGISYE